MGDMMNGEIAETMNTERLPTPEASARAAVRGKVLTWFVAFLVLALAVTWVGASFVWFMAEQRSLNADAVNPATPFAVTEAPDVDEPPAMAAIARPTGASDATSEETPAPETLTQEAAPAVAEAETLTAPIDEAADQPAAPAMPRLPVLRVDEGRGAAPLLFVGVDIEPVWGAGFDIAPVGVVTRISADSGLAGLLCLGDVVIAVDNAGVQGVTAAAMTHALEDALYARDAFVLRLAGVETGLEQHLAWGAADEPALQDAPAAPARTCAGPDDS